ncbi:glycosyltransferase [Methylobacterium haplocladii]|uniref:glycosyltransferase n=1 Tax=Methylobacterium haplocladii TaxID=1176176 RepID=UPI00147824B1|nr:glycosyltransferase [Methylobacterium haplocladii]
MSEDRLLPASVGLSRIRDEVDALLVMVLSPGFHAEGLTRLAARALERGWLTAAFAYADRRCRIRPVPQARDYLLRAEASHRLGDWTGAADDARKARELDPNDPLVNQMALRCLEGAERTEAAGAMISSQQATPAQLAQAIAELDCAATRVLAQLEAGPYEVSGWVSWPRGASVSCRVRETTHVEPFRLQPDERHPLATATRCATQLTVPRRPTMSLHLQCEADSPTAGWERVFEPLEPDFSLPSLDRSRDATVLVIVPVYEDRAATLACLDSLKAQRLPRGEIAVVVIEDASPNPDLVADLVERAGRGAFQLLRNPRNLGFAASVNRAATSAGTGDILILNADTLLPPDAIARLLGVLDADPAAGTVTPLSNNGELTSFPVPFTLNPLPDWPALLAWDAAAANVAAPAIDLPTGIGFCMLVRRGCWAALGGIAQIYGRGYYEDVDLCLRARDLGYRNLCATNLVVGHAGSRSFRSDKRALVVQNLETITARFPSLDRESAAFFRATPLRAIFAEIERQIPPPAHGLLLVTGLPEAHPTTRSRIRTALDAGERVLLLSVSGDDSVPTHVAATGETVRLRSALGEVPQSLRFAIDRPNELDRLCAYLRRAAIARIECLDLQRCPPGLVAALQALGPPIDVLIAEAGALGVPAGAEPNPASAIPDPEAGAPGDLRPPSWLSLLRADDRILVSDALALAATRRALHGTPAAWRIDPKPRCQGNASGRVRTAVATGSSTLSVLVPVATGAATRFLLTLRAALARARSDLQIVVVGATLNDLSLLAGGRVFVTGAIAEDDLGRVLTTHGCDRLILPCRTGLFHGLEAARPFVAKGVGYFDWSYGGYVAHPGDLALDPRWDDHQAVARILDWSLPAATPAAAASEMAS